MWTALLAALGMVLTACSGSSSTSGAGTSGTGTVDRSATIRVAASDISTVFDPIKIEGNGNIANLTLPEVYDQLLQLDSDLQPSAMLATSWEYSDGGRELTLTLREDVTFNSGDPLDASAVKQNLDRARTDSASLVSSLLSTVSEVTAEDDYTVRIDFSKPTYNFTSLLASDPRVSSIVDPKYLNSSDLEDTPHGSGPYTVASASSSKIVFERVKNHWDDSSGLAQRIEVSVIANAESRLNALKAGQIDVTLVDFGQYDTTQTLAETGQYQTYMPENRAQKFVMRVNTNKSSLSDPQVRKALSLGVDRTSLCENQYGGLAEPSQQLFVSSNEGYDASYDTADQLSAKPSEARSMLADAGASDLTITLLVYSLNTSIAEVIQQQLEDIGVTVKIVTRSTLASYVDAWLSGQYDTQLASLSGTADSTTLLQQNITDGVSGMPDYLSDAVDEANNAEPGEARTAAFEEVNSIMIDQPVDVSLCSVGLGLVATSDVVGLDSVRYISFSPPYELRRLGISG